MNARKRRTGGAKPVTKSNVKRLNWRLGLSLMVGFAGCISWFTAWACLGRELTRAVADGRA